MKASLRFVALGVIAMFISDMALALPRFASRTGAKCQSCHVNPSGGGMRRVFGATYGRDELPVPTWSEEFELEDFTTMLTNFLGVGADFRTLFFYQQIPDTGAAPPPQSSNNAFFQMQGDLYLNFRIAKRVSIYLDKGLYSGFEIFGLLNILPARGFIKVGKFVPNFGTKLDDHTIFIREFTGFSAERGRPELTGAEVGFSPGPATIVGGIYNAADGFGSGTGRQKAVLGRVEGMFNVADDANLGIGGNVFTKENTSGVRTTLFGGFGSFSYKNLTIFGEVDLMQTKSGGTTTDAVVSYVEVNYVVTTGVDLKFAYDFYDPDRDLKTGSLSRYSFGFEFFPLSGVEVRPMYRIMKEEPTDVKNDEFHLLVHFYL
ncbi:MAG: hypothetical protein O7D34_01160 [Ignavibacteria bacterium]|nr:hypothetical protein [Ignavibacteria bacterium]